MVVVRIVLLSSLVLAGDAAANPRPPDEVTVSLGAALPLFVLYEFPGPAAAVSAGWQMTDHVQAFASADVGLMIADGARRYVGSLGAGVRAYPWSRGPVWGQIGLGVTGFVEKIGVILPSRRVTATDVGGLVTIDLSIGIRLQGWELSIAYDHNVVPWSYYNDYTGDESLPHRGTGMVLIGRQL